MFLVIAMLFIICGVLFLWKAIKMSGKPSLRIIVGVCGAILAIIGIVLAYHLVSGNIVLPLR